MKICFSIKILIVMLAVTFLPAWTCQAAGPTQAGVSAAVSEDLETLLTLLDSGRETGFDSNRIPALMAFVYAPKPPDILYTAGENFNTNSAYGEFDIKTRFDEFLKFAFNPDVPSYLLMPASIRQSHWKTVDGKQQPFPKLWQALPNLTGSIAIRGIEFVENTPDLHSGAYFAYDLDKLLILMKHGGRFVLLSISKQTRVSEVGKKGVILGPDDDWTYLYSGQNGIARPGLGWVSSYMYDSYSVAVYTQLEKGQPGVRCGTFKWINAGWSKINMVKKEHIHRGLVRYAKTFKEIIEDPVLPTAGQIAQTYSRIRSYSLAQLQTKFHSYLNALETRHRNDASFPQEWFQEWFKSNRYLQQLTKEELESVLIVEYMKHSLGRRSQIDMGDIIGTRRLPLWTDNRLAYKN
ncbi:MAG: hypothetical protein GY697_02755 [Desulfobacterales bacterium]|nr:hypothetical protein [Desulfobacterales bacterium]